MTPKPQLRVALILGATVRPDGSASPALERRARHAAELWRSAKIDILIPTGGMPKAGRSEACVIAELLDQQGVPQDRIIVEKMARNTWENIALSKPLIPKNAKLTLVTDAYHAPRACLMARRQGLHVERSSPSLAHIAKTTVIKNILREVAALLKHLFYQLRGMR